MTSAEGMLRLSWVQLIQYRLLLTVAFALLLALVSAAFPLRPKRG